MTRETFRKKSSPYDTKHMDVAVLEIKALDSDAGTFSAYANTFDIVDHAGDLSVKGCFVNCINKYNAENRMPKFLAQHEGRMMPIGIITKMIEDEKGLYFEAKFCLDTQAGREYYALVKMGAIDQFSIGYITVNSKTDRSGVNLLMELDVKEISIVTFPCNENSRVQSVKSALIEGKELTPRMMQDTLRDVYHLSKRQAEAAVNAIKSQSNEDEEHKMSIKNIEDFRGKTEQFASKDMRKTNGLETKELGGLSFSDVCRGLRQKAIKIVGHNDLYVYEVYDGKAFVHYWDFIDEKYKVVEVLYTVTEGEVVITSSTKGTINYDPTFVADTVTDDTNTNTAAVESKGTKVEEENEEEENEEDVEGQQEEKSDSLADLLSKSDLSTWFAK